MREITIIKDNEQNVLCVDGQPTQIAWQTTSPEIITQLESFNGVDFKHEFQNALKSVLDLTNLSLEEKEHALNLITTTC